MKDSDKPRRPTKEELEAARDKRIKDVIAPDLDVLFCGINPGLYSGATGHHFARPGNRFWPALHLSGFTDRLLSPYEERELLQHGLGITNLVNRTTARADELTDDELKRGGQSLRRKILRHRPSILAVLGVSAFRIAFGQTRHRHRPPGGDDRRHAGLGSPQSQWTERALPAAGTRQALRGTAAGGPQSLKVGEDYA